MNLKKLNFYQIKKLMKFIVFMNIHLLFQKVILKLNKKKIKNYMDLDIMVDITQELEIILIFQYQKKLISIIFMRILKFMEEIIIILLFQQNLNIF